MNNVVVGNVLSIDGLTITIIMHQNTNLLTYYFEGKIYRGVTIGEYVGIIRGPYIIIGRVEREYLDDKFKEQSNQSYSSDRYERRIQITVIGSIYRDIFEFGIRCLPMVFNEVILLDEDRISLIINSGLKKENDHFYISIGKSVQENINVDIPINGLFNSHIGIFGNTGSGKSNTLTKLYTELFDNKNVDPSKQSRFVILDFNGEYTSEKLFKSNDTEICVLSTSVKSKGKFVILPENFWDVETLSVLLSATEKTQRPFISNMIKYYVNDFNITNDLIVQELVNGFRNVFEANNNKESLNLLKQTLSLFLNQDTKFHEFPYYNYMWNPTNKTFYNETYINSDTTLSDKIAEFKEKLEKNSNNYKKLSVVDHLLIFANLQLIYGLRYNYIQFEHISPLISRIEANRNFIENTISIGQETTDKFIKIYSLKDCNQEAKKYLSLLISKQLYSGFINENRTSTSIVNSCHLIIDEAHNILSEQVTRESDSFKDYRLDVFEQIIKEGRKFGFYLTISSQRPYDISPTIISQLHNFFIHRLVNDLDLRMLSHTVSTLDPLSRARIPNLSPGQCIMTGTLFELPLLVQIKKLNREKSPNSESADLVKLWKIK